MESGSLFSYRTTDCIYVSSANKVTDNSYYKKALLVKYINIRFSLISIEELFLFQYCYCELYFILTKQTIVYYQ